MPSREDYYAAIFGIISPLTSSGFKTVTRRLQLVETFDPAAMPALFQQQISEPINMQNYSMDSGVTFNTLDLCWYIYAYQGDDVAPMTPGLNTLVDTVLAALAQTNTSSGSNPLYVPPDVPPGTGNRLMVLPTGVTYWEGLLGDRAVCRIDLRCFNAHIG